MIRVTENLEEISDLLALACREAGRSVEDVKLLGVSKKQPLEKVRAAAAAGLRDFGENFLQEGLEKIEGSRDLGLCWHFIGHLQSNKTRQVAEHFDWVHAVDSTKIAERLDRQRPANKPPLNICLQVNIDEESTKSGFLAADVEGAAKHIAQLQRVRLRGLMCLPQRRQGFDEQRRPFAKLRQLAAELQQQGLQLDTLSMGMSDDFRAAVFEGATIVRIGSALFGARQH